MNWKYTIGWIVWILGFGVLEYKAIKDKRPGDTLSEHVWEAIGTKDKSPSAINWICRITLGLGFAWLIPHFFTGWNF